MEDHQAADVQFRQLEQDMLVEEEPGTVMRGDLASARQWFPEAQPATSTTSNLKRVRDRRWALNIDTMDTLREIVGEDAWKRVPGTRTEPERD